MSAQSHCVIRLIVPAPACGTARSVALFHRDREAGSNDADCQADLLTGAGAERLRIMDKSLFGFSYWSGDFDSARQNAVRGVQTWRSGRVRLQAEEVDAPAVPCLCIRALSEWHLGENATCQTTMAEAISLAKSLNDKHALAVAIWHAAVLGYLQRRTAEVDRLASALIEFSTRQNFALWLTGGAVLRGWARTVSGDTDEGLRWIEDGLADLRASGVTLFLQLYLGLKAEALHLADRTPEALEAIREAEALIERFGARSVCAELHRLRGVFLSAIGTEETEIEASFCAAIRTAKEQKSVSLKKRAEATYAEYRRQKASGSGGRGIRLPL